MDKYKRYHGIILFVAVIFAVVVVAQNLIKPKFDELNGINSQIETQKTLLQQRQQELTIVQNKIKKIKDSIAGSQKKIYSPVESDLGNDTLFFTLYNDVLEMVNANGIKIKSIDYTHNPKGDSFVDFSKDVYFVCDINMELISNYVKLGKLIQDLYQYPYYIKINELKVKPYAKDKKVLFSNLSLRLYARTSPEELIGQ